MDNNYLYDADKNDLMRTVFTVEDAELLNLANETNRYDTEETEVGGHLEDPYVNKQLRKY